MCLLNELLVRLWPHPNHEVVLHDADAHIASEHEGNTAEHLLFRDITTVRQDAAYALGQPFVVSQPASSYPSNAQRASRLQHYGTQFHAALLVKQDARWQC